VGVALRVGDRRWEVGTGDFFHAFFSTISYHLEPEGWGTRFPVLMDSLYQGALGANQADPALLQLTQAKKGLAGLPPSSVVWDVENLAASPPWGDNISEDIKDLAGYFITSDGKDLFEVLLQALACLKQTGGDLTVE
jgi:2,3-bisphosphoglycerate-dependent phosphoglycerate mutase